MTGPPDLVQTLRSAFGRNSVDEFWNCWSAGAEAGLLRSYQTAGGPVTAGKRAFLGRGTLQIRRRRIGGRAAGGTGSSKSYCVSQGDEVDVASAQHFVNSSVAPVLLFRRRFKSVADVLEGIRQNGFSQGRWDALLRRWKAVCDQVPCGPLRSLVHWVLPDLHKFCK